jgi:hypothetical protein
VRDEMNTLRWLYLTVHFKKPDWTPEPLPRPGVAVAKPTAVSEQGYSVLAAHLSRTQADEDTTYN